MSPPKIPQSEFFTIPFDRGELCTCGHTTDDHTFWEFACNATGSTVQPTPPTSWSRVVTGCRCIQFVSLERSQERLI